MLDWIAHHMLPCLTRISIPKTTLLIISHDGKMLYRSTQFVYYLRFLFFQEGSIKTKIIGEALGGRAEEVNEET